MGTFITNEIIYYISVTKGLVSLVQLTAVAVVHAAAVVPYLQLTARSTKKIYKQYFSIPRHVEDGGYVATSVAGHNPRRRTR